MNPLVLYIAAFILFLLAAFTAPYAPTDPWFRRVHPGWLALACWVATYIKF